MMRTNPMLLIDFYKAVHDLFLPEGLTKSMSYATPRMGRVNRWDKMVMFILQAFCKTYLNDYFNTEFFEKSHDEVIESYTRVMDAALGKNVYGIEKISKLHMVSLMKVTDETSSRYNTFLDDAATSAKELGRSVSSLIEQSATWAKLGYTLDQAEELAKLSSIYANVAEVDDATAVSDMVTAMKAFNIEAEKAVTVIDPLNELGNTFATDAAALGDALSRSASAMNAAGTDMYKTLAMITGGAEITQNASEFGNFLKVASMRLRGKRLFMPTICESK